MCASVVSGRVGGVSNRFALVHPPVVVESEEDLKWSDGLSRPP